MLKYIYLLISSLLYFTVLYCILLYIFVHFVFRWILLAQDCINRSISNCLYQKDFKDLIYYSYVLRYIDLDCTELICIVLYCSVLNCIVLYYSVHYSTVLFNTIHYCTVLFCIIQNYNDLVFTLLICIIH